MREEAIHFGDGQHLVGVISAPEHVQTHAPAVLFFNAGLIHHIGPSRLYVRLARRLSALGFVTLRFDFSGVGDSGTRTDGTSIEEVILGDTRQAMDYLEEQLGITRFILMGHCSGAWAAFVGAAEDERIVGSVLMNPEAGQEDWIEYDRQRKVSRYYENYYAREAITDPERWKKLLTGKADYGSIARNVMKSIVLNRVSTATFKLRQQFGLSEAAPSPLQQRWPNITETFIQRPVQLLLIFSKGSSAIEHAHTVIGKELDVMLRSGVAQEVIISNADHTFTLLAGQQAVMKQIETWAQTLSSEQHPATDRTV